MPPAQTASHSPEGARRVAFDYDAAFSRNLGWVTDREQRVLRDKHVAIAGLGGVGGAHLLTLTRLGVGSFSIADFDTFDIVNFNRQAGANLQTLGRPKVEVLAEMARAINPELRIRSFATGVSEDNISDFLSGADCYVDGLDFFAFAAREMTFGACARLGVPAVTAAPIGMGVALLNFLPDRMTFEEYFRVAGLPDAEKALRFLAGLTPAMLHRSYLVDRSRVSLSDRRGPSTAMACEMCAGIAATEALKILLQRGRVLAAPWGQHFDAYTGRFKRTWRPGGNANPIQRGLIAIARRAYNVIATPPEPEARVSMTPIEQVLDKARWAPSGDNTQPWRFQILSPTEAIVHTIDTRRHCVYDLTGEPSQIAVGALLETARIAATGLRMRAETERLPTPTEEKLQFRLRLVEDGSVEPSSLIPCIETRCTNRRPFSRRPLTTREKASLEDSVGTRYRLLWLEGDMRWEMAKLMFRSARIRLTIKEAYDVHASVIEWHARFSETKIPDQAVGLDPVGLALMRWAMRSWDRTHFLSMYLGGTLLPRIQLELLPGLGCAAHVAILPDRSPKGVDDWIDAGRAVQRLWLTAEKLGLQHQPEMTPLIFARYASMQLPFSASLAALGQAEGVAQRLRALIDPRSDGQEAVWLGRIGQAQRPAARSIRRPSDSLVLDGAV